MKEYAKYLTVYIYLCNDKYLIIKERRICNMHATVLNKNARGEVHQRKWALINKDYLRADVYLLGECHLAGGGLLYPPIKCAKL